MAEQLKLKELLIEFADVFSQHDLDIGCYERIKHTIDTKDARPIRQRMRRTPFNFQAEEEKHLNKLLNIGVIEPSSSDWATAPVLIRKKDGSVRYAIDYRALNNVTVKDAFPLPLIEDCFDSLEGVKYFSGLDMASGYYQLEVAECDKPKTAFITRYGLFQHTRMGFGLCNAPATFQRAMQTVLKGLNWKEVLAYLDDIIVLGTTFESHLANLALVFQRFRVNNLKLKPRKCELFRHQLKFLGWIVSDHGIAIPPENIDAIISRPRPQNVTETQSLLGYLNYHRNHIERFAELAAPLYALTGKSAKKLFEWTPEHETSFQALKHAMTQAPVMHIPNTTGLFILDTDASNIAVAAELSQIQNDEECVIAYGSFGLDAAQRRYCTTRKELLAIVRFTREYRHYLLGRQFVIRTDHGSLVWILRFKNADGQLARWLEELSQYDMVIQHRPGVKHVNADWLSRPPEGCDCYRAGSTLESLPCGGCPYCTRVTKQWAQFTIDVDDVLPSTVLDPLKIVHAKICQVNEPADTEDNMEPQETPHMVSTIGVDDMLSSAGPAPSKIVHDKTCQVYEPVHTEDIIEPQGTPRMVPRKVAPNWCHTTSTKELSDLQRDDPDLTIIFLWSTQDIMPTENELALSSSVSKYYWVHRHLISHSDNMLYYDWFEKNTGQTRKLLIIPESLKVEILKSSHDEVTSGHFCSRKTLSRIREHYFWRLMGRDCDLYVHSCNKCSQHKNANVRAKAPLVNYQAGNPLDRIHIDILGPFPPSKSGNRYVLMLIDQFTRWLEAYPLPDQTAEQVARVIVDQFISRFGSPIVIHSDQGRNFESDLFRAVCNLLEVARTRTTPTHPASNGQVERYNRVILALIRCHISGENDRWDEAIPLLTGAIRSMKNRHTGMTANMLMLGREVRRPISLVYGKNEITPEPCSHEYVQKLLQSFSHVHRLARKQIGTAMVVQKDCYDHKIRRSDFHPGDLVYRQNLMFKKGESRKLAPPWIGPFLVIKQMSEVNYRVQGRRRTFVLHHNILSPCRDRVVPLWMQRLRHRFLLKLDQEEEFLPLPNLWEEPADLVASSPLTPLIHPSQPQPVRSSSPPRDAAITPRTSQSPLRTSQFPTRTSQSPPRTSQSSLRTSQSPTQTSQSPLRASQSPLRTSQSPLRTSQSPLRPSQSPLRTSQSPLRTSQSPLRPSQSPLRTSQSPLRTSQSPPRVPRSPPETPAPLVTPQIISRSPVSSPIDPDRTIAYETIPYSMVMTTPPPKKVRKKRTELSFGQLASSRTGRARRTPQYLSNFYK